MELSSSHNDASFYANINEDYIDDLVRKELESMPLDLNEDRSDRVENDDDELIDLTDNQEEIDDFESQRIVE